MAWQPYDYSEQDRLVREDPKVAAANAALERVFGRDGEEAANEAFNAAVAAARLRTA